MGFKNLKVFIGMALSVSTLSACSMFLPPVNRKSSDVASANVSSNEPESFLSAANNGVGEDVEDYHGDDNKEIGTIPNSPVTSYQPATLAKIREFCDLGYGTSYKREWFYNSTVELMLSAGAGDELVCAFVDLALNVYGEYGIARPSNDEAYINEMVGYAYDALKILNSVDFNKAADFLDKWNEIYIADVSDWNINRLNEGIMSYYNPNIGVSYSSIQSLKKHQNEFNNTDLDNVVEAYDEQYEDFSFTDRQIASYNDYKAHLQSEIDEQRGLFPNEIVSFLRKHANKLKPVLIKDLKLFLDAEKELSTITFDAMDYTYNGRTTSSIQYYTESGSMRSSHSTDGGFNYHNYFVKILEKRQTILGLLKAILANDEMGDLLIDASLDLVIPLLRSSFPSNANNNRVLNGLVTKLQSLSGQHVTALFNFLIKLINQVYDEDIIDALSYAYRVDEYANENKQFDFNAFGDKYINKLDEIIGSLTANEKRLISELLDVCGIDVFGEIEAFTAIFKDKNLSTESSRDAYYEALNEWFNNLGRKMGDALALTYEDENSSGHDDGSVPGAPIYQDETYPHVQISFDSYSNPIVKGDDVDSIKDKIFIDYYNRIANENYGYVDVNLSASYSNWNQQLAEIRQQYENDRDYYENYADEYEKVRMEAMVNLPNVSNLALTTFDAANVGYTDIVGSFKLGEETYDINEKDVIVRPALSLPKVRYMNNDGGYEFRVDRNNQYQYLNFKDENELSAPVCWKDADATLMLYYYNYGWEQQNNNIAIDTSKAGWNVFTTELPTSSYDESAETTTYIFVYYVLDKAILNNSLVNQTSRTGIYLEGESDFSNTPEVYYLYETNDFFLEVSKSLPFDQGLVTGKAANAKYTVINDGVEYSFVILKKDNTGSREYSFHITNPIAEQIRNPISVTASVWVSYSSTVKIDGEYYNSYYSASLENQTLTNFTIINGVISFIYDGIQFTFNASY